MKKHIKKVILLILVIVLAITVVVILQKPIADITEFTAAYCNQDTILLQWKDMDAKTYHIYRSDKKNSSYKEIGTSDTNEYKDTGVKQNDYYKVVSNDHRHTSQVTKALYEEYADNSDDMLQHQLSLTSVENARDLGGYKTKEDKTVVTGKLLRTARLSNLSDCDKDTLVNIYHVSKIIDLRTAAEIRNHPDTNIPGIKNINISSQKHTYNYSKHNINTKDKYTRICTFAKYEDFCKYKRETMKDILESDYSKEKFKEMFEEILSANGNTVLFHCTHGKDRTGLASAMILAVLGVSDDDIIQDYLLTNTAYLEDLAKANAKATEMNLSDEEKLAVEAHFGVYPQDFIDVLDSINEEYGSLENYVKQEIGLTDDQIQQLKTYYLE